MTDELLRPGAAAPLTRRGFLGAALGAGAAAFAGRAQAYAPRPAPPRALTLRNANTDEGFSGVYYHDGLYEPGAMEALDILLRDHRANAALMMDVRLYDLLAELQARIGGAPLIITSGYRTPETNALLKKNNEYVAKNSLHLQGMAADIKTPGVDLEQVKKIALAMGRGGVGSYAGASFLHLDVGDVRVWRY